MSSPSKLVIGLGNPGARYAGTRHNFGWRVLEDYAARTGAQQADGRKYDAKLFRKGDLLLAEPQTFMNLSGEPIHKLVRFYDIDIDSPNVLTLSDDLDLPFGTIRYIPFGKSSGSGGHQGLKDLFERLGTDRLARIRLGIGRPPDGMAAKDFVLQPFTVEEEAILGELIAKAMDQIDRHFDE